MHGPGLRTLAPAKINLALHVTGRRTDGYHLIDTLVTFAEAGDALELKPAVLDSFTVSGRYGGDVPIDGDNLVLKARDLLRRRFGVVATRPVSIRLVKNLPVASGIGGGSSDAAALLRGLDAMLGIDAGPEALGRIGLELGADLPMCVAGQPLTARGIGDETDPVAPWPQLPIVLANPGVAVATPDVFAQLTRRDGTALPPLPERRDVAAVLAWLAATRNDLEPPAIALAPAISEALAALDANGARFSRMSGSGATCFGVFETMAAADTAARAIGAAQPGWFVAATQTRGTTP
ncbi:4-(cytidine 5'-diphospho)-2-C-methyl-D-erythritol kinase [Nitratireductor mangrovi]|uniref:4-diphosphocytidyl-2-C-methyl-D-erythritol kinase n=1 Tax=Nitratireductor mangrovi TaxID=2599600 RepID=A0A5B8KYA7_9HYPH|nr:4-(cytidine 5'-diphospho)-2-C-methyl-D-erythritol kinase [Nitratireductor mangrovi]QDZ00458.1 4-(cytidine 5'-diphospho)-2-C-methyl-D-erythritol kinase [Nitratireductor mangrovi]